MTRELLTTEDMTLDPENSEMGENKHDDNRSMACTPITCRDKYTQAMQTLR